MCDIVSVMQPRYEAANTDLINELDEFLEIIFIVNGTFKCGFSLNGNIHWVLK